MPISLFSGGKEAIQVPLRFPSINGRGPTCQKPNRSDGFVWQRGRILVSISSAVCRLGLMSVQTMQRRTE